jgi:hypothetical protein
MCNWVKNSHGNSEKIAQFCVENEKDAEEEGSIYIAPLPLTAGCSLQLALKIPLHHRFKLQIDSEGGEHHRR